MWSCVSWGGCCLFFLLFPRLLLSLHIQKMEKDKVNEKNMVVQPNLQDRHTKDQHHSNVLTTRIWKWEEELLHLIACWLKRHTTNQQRTCKQLKSYLSWIILSILQELSSFLTSSSQVKKIVFRSLMVQLSKKPWNWIQPFKISKFLVLILTIISLNFIELHQGKGLSPLHQLQRAWRRILLSIDWFFLVLFMLYMGL